MPFVIRFLGAEAYGVYILVILIPGYFYFADFGMNMGSTKFGSEAYARGARDEEGRIIRTAALVAFLSSLPVAFVMFVFSLSIAAWLNVPARLQAEASLALKIASVTFVLNFLCNIFNTPQFIRLRMDLNTFVTAGFKILAALMIPVVLYAGGGIVGAVSVLLIATFATLLVHLYVSGRLLNELFQFSISRTVVKPLLKFGGALVISGIAGVLLVNLEKLVLARVTSVETLAFYSVAFMLANVATLFSSSMIQSLLPAFSQLLRPEKKEELNTLFSRSLRINMIGFIPFMLLLFVLARPFFTIWAGENFGSESTIPFYVLLFGVFFNIIAYVPYGVLMAAGRTDLLARIYWIELFPYIMVIALLTYEFGAVGAAAAWSIRVIVDSAVIIWFSKKSVGISLDMFQGKGSAFLLIFLLLIPSVLIVFFIGNYSVWLLLTVPAFLIIYLAVVWRKLLHVEEKVWMSGKLPKLFKR